MTMVHSGRIITYNTQRMINNYQGSEFKKKGKIEIEGKKNERKISNKEVRTSSMESRMCWY